MYLYNIRVAKSGPIRLLSTNIHALMTLYDENTPWVLLNTSDTPPASYMIAFLSEYDNQSGLINISSTGKIFIGYPDPKKPMAEADFIRIEVVWITK